MPALGVTTGRELLKAGEVARQTGLTRQTLHQYVVMGLLQPVDATKGGQRLFDETAVERVNLIRKLCAGGYTLQAVRDIFLKEQRPGAGAA